MSRGVQSSLFFLSLPDLKKLVRVTLTVQEDDEELRSKQIKTCRELVLLYSDVLASPAVDSFTDIIVVMAIPFFQKGVLQLFGQRCHLQLASPQCVFPGDLQCCLSYSLITRLAPIWNKVGLCLVSGKDFLSDRGTLNAVSMELSTTEGQLCVSIDTFSIRLPPTTLEDFDLPPLVQRRFCSDPNSVLDPASMGGIIWCHVLPSMKKGQIITISRQLPRDGPFKTYRDLQNHWSHLYGYRLPEFAEDEVVYCSVYFRLVGERLFTYPLSCIRLQTVQRCSHGDMQGALDCFMSDVRERVQTVCGFPARLTRKPCYHSVGVNSAASAQVLSGEQVNLTTSSSVRPILTQLPAPSPPVPPEPGWPSCGWQRAAWTRLSQQDRAQGLLGNGCGTGSSLTETHGCRRVRERSSSSSSSSVSFSFSLASSLPPPKAASSSVLPALPPPVNPAPKRVPIFRNKHSSRHVNIAPQRIQVQKEQLMEAGEKRRRVTLPAFRKNIPATVPPPPSFRNCRPQDGSIMTPQPSAQPTITSSLCPAAESKPEHLPDPKTDMKHKSKSSSKTHKKARSEQPSAAPPEVPHPLTSCDLQTFSSSTERVSVESKLKKPRATEMERTSTLNQLSKLNAASLLAWLRGRGVHVSSKHRKEELMLKVMSCLAEA